MAGEELGVHYVSYKISRVRWRPSLRPGLQASRVFAAGSWDNGAENCLQMYAIDDSADISLLASSPHPGNVTDLRFVSLEYLATTSSSGCLTLFEHQKANQSIEAVRSWSLTPGFVLTALAVKGDEAVVVGESGSLHVVDLGAGGKGSKYSNSLAGPSSSPKLSLAAADSFSITSVIYLRPAELLTANSSGQLKLWDLRLLGSGKQQSQHSNSSSSSPSKILSINGERVGVRSLAQHPTQPHLIAAGGDDGLLTIWDLRMEKTPATLLQGHDSPVWDVGFHPSHPDHLFTCSDEGKVLHWDASAGGDGKREKGNKLHLNASSTGRMGPLSVGSSTPGGGASQSPWISSGVGVEKKSNVVTSSLLPTYFNMPVNSVSIDSDILLCGTDAEAIFTVRNLNIH